MSTVLIVEDEAAVRRVCSAVLQRVGYLVLTAGDGAEALRILKTTTVDVVVTDILMPGKEGIETIFDLKREYPQVRIVAMSGGGTIAAENCLALSQAIGVATTLRKPFSQQELVGAVEFALGRQSIPAATTPHAAE